MRNVRFYYFPEGVAYFEDKESGKLLKVCEFSRVMVMFPKEYHSHFLIFFYNLEEFGRVFDFWGSGVVGNMRVCFPFKAYICDRIEEEGESGVVVEDASVIFESFQREICIKSLRYIHGNGEMCLPGGKHYWKFFWSECSEEDALVYSNFVENLTFLGVTDLDSWIRCYDGVGGFYLEN